MQKVEEKIINEKCVVSKCESGFIGINDMGKLGRGCDPSCNQEREKSIFIILGENQLRHTHAHKQTVCWYAFDRFPTVYRRSPNNLVFVTGQRGIDTPNDSGMFVGKWKENKCK